MDVMLDDDGIETGQNLSGHNFGMIDNLNLRVEGVQLLGLLLVSNNKNLTYPRGITLYRTQAVLQLIVVHEAPFAVYLAVGRLADGGITFSYPFRVVAIHLRIY